MEGIYQLAKLTMETIKKITKWTLLLAAYTGIVVAGYEFAARDAVMSLIPDNTVVYEREDNVELSALELELATPEIKAQCEHLAKRSLLDKAQKDLNRQAEELATEAKSFE